MTAIPGLPVIVAETTNETSLTYATKVRPEIFGLSSFVVLYIPESEVNFSLHFADGNVIVDFIRVDLNFVQTQVRKGTASVRIEAETATVEIALKQEGISYNIFSYRIGISRDESQGNVFFLYSTALLLFGTAVTTYEAAIVPGSQPTPQYQLKVRGAEEKSIYFLAVFSSPSEDDSYIFVTSEAPISGGEVLGSYYLRLCSNTSLSTIKKRRRKPLI